MALRFSTALRNYVLDRGSFKQAMQNGAVKIFTGSQPSDGDQAESGTVLVTITDTSGTRTNEVQGQGSVTLSGSGGQVDSLTVDGYAMIGAAVPYNTSLAQTASDLATAINKYGKPLWGVVAASDGVSKVTLTAPRGSGTAYNGAVVSTTVSGGTLAKVDVNIGTATAGVAAVNGLKFGSASAGSMSKDSAQTWSGVAAASGIAGWFRYLGAPTDGGTLDSTAVFVRMDGNVATSGANLNMTSTSITATAVQTISAWTLTYPASGA